MIQAKVTRVINAPYDTVWLLLSDVTTVDKWHPAVKTVELLSEMKKLVTEVFAGIDYHLATGKVVGEDFVPSKKQ